MGPTEKVRSADGESWHQEAATAYGVSHGGPGLALFLPQAGFSDATSSSNRSCHFFLASDFS